MFVREDKVSPIRLTAIQYGILALFLLLLFGFWRLQIMANKRYEELAQQNRIKEVPILAPRGKLLDREGRIIVDNYPSFSAILLRNQGKIPEANLDAIAAGLHLDPAELRLRIKRMAWKPGYEPIFLKSDITPDELAFIEAHRNEYPELDTITVHRRLYPKNGFMAHLIGYVGEVSDDMLNSPRFEVYNPGDIVGISGVEAEYNDILMGQNGSRRVLVNSRGKEVGELSEKPAIPGKSLKLTIDLDIQIAAEEALGDKNGAIVAMDPKTGEILAMVSRPTFDPNDFAVRISSKEWSQLVNDPNKPLLNKAIQAQLAPGSVFKIIMSVAGWQEGVAQDMHVHCSGGAVFYGRRFACWVKGGHGEVDLTKAIYQSCDVFFYTLAEKLGIDRIAKYATMLGLGHKTGIDLPNEASGVMPSEEWKIKNFKQKWFAGETISVGIGQGAVATTPVQLMRAIAAIAMDGRMVVPHVANPTDLPQRYIEANHYNDIKNVSIDPNGWNVITDAMSRVLLPEGTAPSAHIPGIDIAGKTGSAQTISNAMKAKIANKAEFKDNGWFVGFTPRRDPNIIVAVLTEGGEHGYLAARVATQVIKAYVEKQRKLEQPQGQQNVAQTNAGGNSAQAKPTAEVNGIWTDGNQDKLNSGKFQVALDEKPKPAAQAAPGMENVPAGQEQKKPKLAEQNKPAGETSTATKTEQDAAKPKPANQPGAASKVGEAPTPKKSEAPTPPKPSEPER
ncbi:MAG: penicillin-binding protein 2 [Terriglobia bacterium]|nr:penicillin-binding protein 2 [Terriglobia bacterium]